MVIAFNAATLHAQPTLGAKGPVAGRVAASRFKWEDSRFNSETEGGIWPTNTYFNWVFNKEFNAENTSGIGSTPFGIMALAHNNGSQGNVVALGADTVLRTSNGTGFAANFIVRSDIGVQAPKMVGLELDIEPAHGVVPRAGSIALPINIFNSSYPGPAIQTGGVSGGTFANGIVLYGIASSGAGLSAGNGAHMNALVNSSGCNCGNAAFVHGTGPNQGDAYGTRGLGASPFIYGDEAQNLVLRMGSSGGLTVYGSDGNAPLLTISAEGRIAVFGIAAVDCSGPPSRAFRVTNGIVTHC